MDIDFTPTAYTVKDPGNGQLRRYDGYYSDIIDVAREEFGAWARTFPSLAQFIVPDHFVQEYIRAYESSLYAGGNGRVYVDVIFLKLAEAGARQARFN